MLYGLEEKLRSRTGRKGFGTIRNWYYVSLSDSLSLPCLFLLLLAVAHREIKKLLSKDVRVGMREANDMDAYLIVFLVLCW